MPRFTPEEVLDAKKHLTPNSQLEVPAGHSRMVIPGMPSLPLRDNNNMALRKIAESLGGEVNFVSDKK